MLIAGGSGSNPFAILALSNGNLLIADSDLGNDSAGHHQLLEYYVATGGIGQLIDLTEPVDSSGDPPQPTSIFGGLLYWIPCLPCTAVRS